MTDIKGTILIVDDDATFRKVSGRALERRGYQIISAESGAEVLNKQLAMECDVAIIDLRMPEMDGLELLQRIKAVREELPIILLTGDGTINTAIEAIQQGAFHYLTKPCEIPEMEAYIQKALHQQKISRENEYLRTAMQKELSDQHGIVGNSPAIGNLLNLIDRVKDSEAAVLVTGESGTGKELVARALHFQSTRKDQPFIAVNCATLKPDLLENELFGHVSGAFTGATTRKDGLLSVASGGTLFIDEIADMDPNVQASLLRVIETGEYRPLGSTKERTTNVRIVAAANRNLADEVRAGRFREDLFYRLNVLVIATPPLRMHKEDIPALVENFLNRPGPRKKDFTFSNEAIQTLQTYDWPGNVRELMNICERAVLLSQDTIITAEEIQSLLNMARPFELQVYTTIKPTNQYQKPLSLDEAERNHIQNTLAFTKGNVSQAAELLGIDRRTLQRKMARFDLRESNPSTL